MTEFEKILNPVEDWVKEKLSKRVPYSEDISVGMCAALILEYQREMVSSKEILRILSDDKYLWQGSLNGDTQRKYQSRQAERMSYLLILISRVLASETPILTLSEMQYVLDYHLHVLSGYDATIIHYGCDHFTIKGIIVEWKDLIKSMRNPLD